MSSVLSLDALHKRVYRASKAGEKDSGNVPVAEVITAGCSVFSLSEEASRNAPAPQEKPKAGRPKGSTKGKKVEEATKYRMCTLDIVDYYELELGAPKALGLKRYAKIF